MKSGPAVKKKKRKIIKNSNPDDAFVPVGLITLEKSPSKKDKGEKEKNSSGPGGNDGAGGKKGEKPKPFVLGADEVKGSRRSSTKQEDSELIMAKVLGSKRMSIVQSSGVTINGELDRDLAKAEMAIDISLKRAAGKPAEYNEDPFEDLPTPGRGRGRSPASPSAPAMMLKEPGQSQGAPVKELQHLLQENNQRRSSLASKSKEAVTVPQKPPAEPVEKTEKGPEKAASSGVQVKFEMPKCELDKDGQIKFTDTVDAVLKAQRVDKATKKFISRLKKAEASGAQVPGVNVPLDGVNQGLGSIDGGDSIHTFTTASSPNKEITDRSIMIALEGGSSASPSPLKRINASSTTILPSLVSSPSPGPRGHPSGAPQAGLLGPDTLRANEAYQAQLQAQNQIESEGTLNSQGQGRRGSARAAPVPDRQERYMQQDPRYVQRLVLAHNKLERAAQGGAGSGNGACDEVLRKLQREGGFDSELGGLDGLLPAEVEQAIKSSNKRESKEKGRRRMSRSVAMAPGNGVGRDLSLESLAMRMEGGGGQDGGLQGGNPNSLNRGGFPSLDDPINLNVEMGMQVNRRRGSKGAPSLHAMLEEEMESNAESNSSFRRSSGKWDPEMGRPAPKYLRTSAEQSERAMRLTKGKSGFQGVGNLNLSQVNEESGNESEESDPISLNEPELRRYKKKQPADGNQTRRSSKTQNQIQNSQSAQSLSFAQEGEMGRSGSNTRLFRGETPAQRQQSQDQALAAAAANGTAGSSKGFLPPFNIAKKKSEEKQSSGPGGRPRAPSLIAPGAANQVQQPNPMSSTGAYIGAGGVYPPMGGAYLSREFVDTPQPNQQLAQALEEYSQSQTQNQNPLASPTMGKSKGGKKRRGSRAARKDSVTGTDAQISNKIMIEQHENDKAREESLNGTPGGGSMHSLNSSNPNHINVEKPVPKAELHVAVSDAGGSRPVSRQNGGGSRPGSRQTSRARAGSNDAPGTITLEVSQNPPGTATSRASGVPGSRNSARGSARGSTARSSGRGSSNGERERGLGTVKITEDMLREHIAEPVDPYADLPLYLDKALAYNLDLFSLLETSSVTDLATWCLANSLGKKGGDPRAGRVFILGQLHYSKYDALHMVRVFQAVRPAFVGLESPLDGCEETWKGLSQAFCREIKVAHAKRDTPLGFREPDYSTASPFPDAVKFLTTIGSKAGGGRRRSNAIPVGDKVFSGMQNFAHAQGKVVKGSELDASLCAAPLDPDAILSICNSFSVALPRHLASLFGGGELLHIDANREQALNAVQLMNRQSIGHYLNVVSNTEEEEYRRKQLNGEVVEEAETSGLVANTSRSKDHRDVSKEQASLATTSLTLTNQSANQSKTSGSKGGNTGASPNKKSSSKKEKAKKRAKNLGGLSKFIENRKAVYSKIAQEQRQGLKSGGSLTTVGTVAGTVGWNTGGGGGGVDSLNNTMTTMTGGPGTSDEELMETLQGNLAGQGYNEIDSNFRPETQGSFGSGTGGQGGIGEAGGIDVDSLSPQDLLKRAATASYNVVPTHRLAYVLRDVSERTEPPQITQATLYSREKGMAEAISAISSEKTQRSGFAGQNILAIVGCQHIPGLVSELKKLGFTR